MKYTKSDYYCFGICGIIGGILFLLIYGFAVLNPTYDHWILNGYAEIDIIQHYAGWMAFRDSEWLWPLGKVSGLGDCIISFTDSIPWIAILLKTIRGILPTTFQFFGIYIFGCMILQGISSGMIIREFSNKKIFIAIGVILFCLSPIMLERAFRHTALASHWLILSIPGHFPSPVRR